MWNVFSEQIMMILMIMIMTVVEITKYLVEEAILICGFSIFCPNRLLNQQGCINETRRMKHFYHVKQCISIH